jgi:hypothetical protein
MIYNQLNLQNQDFVNQGIGQNPKVYIRFNGTNIHNITGPVPLIDISHSVNNDNNDFPDTITTNINLTGKIYRHPASGNLSNVDTDKNSPGISGILFGISGLKDLFSSCPYGKLEILCGNSALYTVSGLTIQNMKFDQSDDNWIQTTDYNISLSVTDSLYGGDPLTSYNGDILEKYVTDRQDSWTIEPLDDFTFADLSYTVTQRSEYSNPGLGLNNNTNPPRKEPASTTGSQDPEHGSSAFKIRSFPQFRVNRRVSAKGLIPKEAANNDKLCFNSTDGSQKVENIITRPYVYAKAWVEKIARAGLQASNSISDNFIGFLNPNSKIFPCNHTRSTNIDIYVGSYEINDSWLVMTTGVPYTETYTIETSLDENHIKTVRIAGSINGLSILPDNVVQHQTGLLPTGIGNTGLIDGQINLDYSKLLANRNIPNFTPNHLTANPNSSYTRNSIGSDRYNNATRGWLYDIKPLLYRRASLAINPIQSPNNNNLAADRTLNFIPSYTSRPPAVPENPIYSKETLLSIIPVSTSEGHDPRKGIINYSYEFNNKFNIISGVIAENINITYENPITTTSEVAVIGRALGPIIQKTGKTNPKKNISVEISIPPIAGLVQSSLSHPSCPLYTGNFLWRTINRIIDATRPYSKEDFVPSNLIARNNCGAAFKTNDTENWQPYEGKYVRNVSWTYAPTGLANCTNFRVH